MTKHNLNPTIKYGANCGVTDSNIYAINCLVIPNLSLTIYVICLNMFYVCNVIF